MPNTREKLIELLFACVSKNITPKQTKSDRLTIEIHHGDIADHLIANGVTFAKDNNVPNKWIPVSERLPEIASTQKRYRATIRKSIRVLCVCVQKSGKTMVKEGYCEWYNDYPEPRWQIPGTIDSVTHWMPLPEPPKEGDYGY